MNETKDNQTGVRVVAIKADGTKLDVPIQGTPADIVDATERTIVVAGDGGVVTAGKRGAAIAGFQGQATALGSGGLAYVLGGTATALQDGGIAIAATGGMATGAQLAYTVNSGKSIAYGGTIAIAINARGAWDATAQASTGGLLIFGYEDQGTVKYVPVPVDGRIIKGNTPYKLDSARHTAVKA